MSDEVKDMDNSTVTVDSVAEEEKANKESDVVAEISKAVVQFDCLDETPSKSTDSTPKKIAKSKGGLMKLGLGKSDARTRQKVGNFDEFHLHSLNSRWRFSN